MLVTLALAAMISKERISLAQMAGARIFRRCEFFVMIRECGDASPL
jgi:hypothetical protein